MTLPNFSVLLPIYNRIDLKTTFPKCLEHIANSTVTPSELLVIVDGPLSWDIDEQIERLKLQFTVIVLRLEQNRGLTYSLNYGLKFCSCDIIARVDADDFCTAERFELQLECFVYGCNLVGSNTQEVDADFCFLKRRVVPEASEDIRKFALRRNPFNHMTVMFGKSLVEDAGGYPDVFLKEDYALWVTLLSSPDCVPYNIQKDLMLVTAGDGLVKRRSSLKIFLSEFRMQGLLRKNLNKRISTIFIDLSLKALFSILPVYVRSKAYRYWLRK